MDEEILIRIDREDWTIYAGTWPLLNALIEATTAKGISFMLELCSGGCQSRQWITAHSRASLTRPLPSDIAPVLNAVQATKLEDFINTLQEPQLGYLVIQVSDDFSISTLPVKAYTE